MLNFLVFHYFLRRGGIIKTLYKTAPQALRDTVFEAVGNDVKNSLK